MDGEFALCVGGPWGGRVVPVRGRTLYVETCLWLRTGVQYRLARWADSSPTSYMLWWIYSLDDDMHPPPGHLAIFQGKEMLCLL